MWQSHNYESCNLGLPSASDESDQETDTEQDVDVSGTDDDDDQNKSIHYVIGDVMVPQQTDGHDAVIVHCVGQSCWNISEPCCLILEFAWSFLGSDELKTKAIVTIHSQFKTQISNHYFKSFDFKSYTSLLMMTSNLTGVKSRDCKHKYY